ncbi:hypothetical protein PAEH1_01555 [Paenalcaligenes hominis]|uniref:Uncharacterized protein n=1 Tax=Paenalcaligenes hominis TaxID=643674 RepID=A0A1U9JXP6_9BURK|nr:hypothetical protein [Paenalcaligenes hominis]AQS50565.1 hypothetical protein PAEH1_01555 [Paenalcaligenes hominis]
MSIPKIDPYPPAPTPEDDEATFDEKAYEHAASLEVRRVQMNEVATYVNTRASDANNRAVAAAASATASANSAARADEWANKAPGSAVASGKYSARHYSDLSDKFANAPEDVEVEPGKFSALHWQEKAKKIANVHATTVATEPLPTVIAANVQEALRGLAYQADQLRVAKNQLKYGDGPYPVLDFQFADAKYLDARIQFTRASKDWDENGQEYGINEPVIMEKGLWSSGARSNLVKWSGDLTKSDWLISSSQYFRTAYPTIHPQRGPIRATLYGPNNGQSSFTTGVVRQAVTLQSDATYTIWLDVKSSDPEYITSVRPEFLMSGGVSVPVYGVFSLTSGGLPTAREDNDYYRDVKVNNISLGEGWRRLSITLTVLSSNLEFTLRFYPYYGGTSVVGDGENGLIVSNVQVEKSRAPTRHIPTEGSQVTVANTNVSFSEIRETRFGCFLLKANYPIYKSFNTFLGLGTLNGEEVRVQAFTFNRLSVVLRAGGLDLSIPSPTDFLSPGDTFKAALSFTQTDDGFLFKFFVNGTYIGSQVLPTLPLGFFNGSFSIGKRRVNSDSLYLEESISSLIFFDKILSDEQLQELTIL